MPLTGTFHLFQDPRLESRHEHGDEGGEHHGPNHSTHHPHCNVPPALYPVFPSDARALGISNRYGFLSLPRPSAELPPLRPPSPSCWRWPPRWSRNRSEGSKCNERRAADAKVR